MTLPQHLSKTNEHYTPENIVEAARYLMGGFDLDPASCLVANQTIQAKQIFDVADDGLSKLWSGRVFLNPPGGLVRRNERGEWVPVPKNEKGRYMGPGDSSMQVWWQYLWEEYDRGSVTQAFFVAFTLEILRTSQKGTPAQGFFRCYPRDRMHFGGDSPTHANVLIWLPPKDERNFTRFRNIFSEIGYCEPGGPVA